MNVIEKGASASTMLSVVGTLLAFAAIGTSCTRQASDALIDRFASTFGTTVTIPARDPTPPTVTLTVPDLGNGQGEIVMHPGDPARTVHVGNLALNGFFAVAAVEDPQGAQSICVHRHGTRQCSKNGLGTFESDD